MILETVRYKNHNLIKMRPHKKSIVKIYDDHAHFKQTCNNMTDAKHFVDFYLKYKGLKS